MLIAASRCQRASSPPVPLARARRTRDIAISRRSRPLSARRCAGPRRRCAPRRRRRRHRRHRQNGSSPAPAPPSPGGGGLHGEDRRDASGDATRRVRVALVAQREGTAGAPTRQTVPEPCLGVTQCVRVRNSTTDRSRCGAAAETRRRPPPAAAIPPHASFSATAPAAAAAPLRPARRARDAPPRASGLPSSSSAHPSSSSAASAASSSAR